jgi:hypothetical protein
MAFCPQIARHGFGIAGVYNGRIDPELVFYSEKAWLNLSSYVNSQNNRYWSAVHEVPLHNLMLVQLMRGG